MLNQKIVYVMKKIIFCFFAVMCLVSGKMRAQNSCGAPTYVRLGSLGGGGAATFVWYDTNRIQPLGWIVEYGRQGFAPGTGTSLFTTTNSAVLTGLVRQVLYQIHVRTVCAVGDTSSPETVDNFFYCGNQRPCIDYTQLFGNATLCTYGTYQTYGAYTQTNPGPYANVGAINFGPDYYGQGDVVQSRHTVHTDPTETDTYTNGQLHTVPNNECESVRLGGRGGANLCQAIKYTFVVDTAQYDALAIRYAPVLTKSATESSTARFTIELLDRNDSLIAPVFDVNPYSTQGWRIGTDSSMVWKPWDFVGLDFGAYHDSTLNLRFTTFHCSDDTVGHFGYAYYSLNSCLKASLLPAQSFMNKTRGMAFVAPSGFRYQWFLYSDTTDIIDTAQMARIPYAERFGCRIFDGFGHSRILSSVAYERTPHAAFTASIGTPDCRRRTISLHGSPFVTIDNDGSVAPENVDFYHWIIDGKIRTEDDTDADFDIISGTHTISFVTGLDYNGRADTMTMSVTVPDTGYMLNNVFDTIEAGETYSFGGETLTRSGIYSDTLRASGGCDSVVILDLTVKGEGFVDADDMSEIRVYPNPVRNVLTIEAQSGIIEKLEVIDNAGRTQLIVTNVRNIDLSGLENGVYHLRMTTPVGVVIKRIVKR